MGNDSLPPRYWKKAEANRKRRENQKPSKVH